MAAVNLLRRFRIELAFHNLTLLIRSQKPHLIWIQRQRKGNLKKKTECQERKGKRKVK